MRKKWPVVMKPVLAVKITCIAKCTYVAAFLPVFKVKGFLINEYKVLGLS